MIQKITLQSIRCFQKAEFKFSPGVNLTIGPNGSGKTTVLEAVLLFVFGRLQSVSKDFLAVRSGEEVGRVEIQIDTEGEKIEASAAILPGEKVFKVFSNKTPTSKMIGFVKGVAFNPETIDLVSGPPAVRRRELDLAIAEKEPVFVKTLLQFKNILKQRNNLLRRIILGKAKKGEIDFWDSELARHSLEIFSKRKEFLAKINRSLGSSYAGLTGRKTNLALEYLGSADYGKFMECLAGSFDSDLRDGSTQVGPHRDDFLFREGKFMMREHSSRGEQRMAAVAFKLEVREFLRGDEEPILVFDDVFSELDEGRREAVSRVIGKGQVFISATDERVVPENLKKKAKVLRLE